MPCNPCIPDTIMLIVISLPATDLQKGASATNHIESPYHRFKMFQTCTSQARITSDRNHQLLSRDSDIVKSPASILTYFNICHHKKTYLQTKKRNHPTEFQLSARPHTAEVSVPGAFRILCEKSGHSPWPQNPRWPVCLTAWLSSFVVIYGDVKVQTRSRLMILYRFISFHMFDDLRLFWSHSHSCSM